MELLPKFREIDLFAIALSLIVIFLLYNTEVLNLIGQFPENLPSSSDVRCLGIAGLACLLFAYAQFLSLKYALFQGMPNKLEATLMVFMALAALIPFSLAGAVQIYINFLYSSNMLDLLVIVFPLFAFVRSAILVSMFPLLLEYYKLFDYKKDATGREVSVAFTAVICIGLIARLFTNYSFLVAFLIMYEVSIMAANAASEKLK